MDPISITAGVLALLGACIKTGAALKDFYDGAAIADTKVKGLLTDVESFTQVLRLMKETLEQENIQSSLQSTGHIGNHWNNLSTSIRDGQNTLLQLQETIEKVNKSVGLLDGPRKHLRFKGAADEIAVFQQQIRSYRDTLQLSLQTVILWNQVTFQESTNKILPNLDEIQQAIRRIAFDINNQIAGLQNVIESNSSDHQLRSLNNLRNCVKSAASVVSSASTTLGVDRSDRFSVSYESEFGDCFLLEPGETMLRWISSNTVYEFEEERDAESSLSGPKPASGKSLQLVGEGKESDQSDSDGELEAEIIQSLLRRGKDKLASREFEAAERHFRNCLARASSNGSAVSLHRVLGSRSEIMTLLLSTYRLQEKWDEAHSLLTEKIALESRGSSKANQVVLADMLILVEVLLKKCAYSEALLYGRRALKSYRKLGSEGTLSVQDSLGLLCQVCKAASNHDEEDAYGAILSDILQQCEPAAKSTTATVSAGHDPEPTTSPTASTIKREGSVESPSVQNLSSPDTLESNNSWLSSGQLTSTSATRTHHRESSLSSLGSAGPASPYTTNTSLSTASREGLPALKDSCLSLPTDTSASQSLPLKLVRLEDTSEQLKVGNDSQALPTSKSTSSVTLTPASDQMSARSASVHEPSKTQKIMTTAIGDLMDEASDVTETADSPKPAVLKWQPSMTVMPVEIDRLEVGFKRPFNREVSQLVRLRNPNSGPVVFKVGTTTPKQYCVRPNWGRIEAGDEFQVLIIKVPMDKDPPLEENSRDKFLFQSVAVTADEQLDSHALISSHINTLLSSPNTKFLTQDKKISVSFFLPEAEPAEEPAATTEAPAATTKAVAPEFTGEDTLGYKGPGSFLNKLIFQKKHFWFGSEPVDPKALTTYLRSEMPEIASYNAAWSSQTGKGLLYFSKRASEKATPAGIINLADITEVSEDGTVDFFFHLHGTKHVFQTSTPSTRESWVAAIKTKSAEAKEMAEGIKSSKGYKKVHISLSKPTVVAPVAIAVAAVTKGPKIKSASDGKTVRLWDSATGVVHRTLEGHLSWVYCVAFSPDGRLVASGAGDGTVRLWDSATGAVHRTLKGHSTVRGVAFSPDGRLVASGSSDNTVRLWDSTTGAAHRTLKGHSAFVRGVAFSPDGRLVASASCDATVRLWDSTTGAVHRTLKGHSGWVWSVAFSPDGRLVASASDDKTVSLWDSATGVA